MAKEFKLPELGEGIESGKVTKVHVAQGDTVSEEDPLFEVETDKAATDVPSDVAGTVAEVRVREGEDISVGQVAVVFEEDGGEAVPEQASGEEEAPPSDDQKEPDAPPPEEQQGTDAPEPEEEKEPADEKPAPNAGGEGAGAKAPEGRGPLPASPSVRRRARELDVDLGEVRGTGEHGRITLEDVESRASSPGEKGDASRERAEKEPSRPPVPTAPPEGGGQDRREPMSAVRRKTAEHMAAAWDAVPHVTHFDKADITAFEKFRKRHGKEAGKDDPKLTVTALVLKVVGAALRAYPGVNAGVDMEKREIIYRSSVNVGVAVDTDRGLLVPVVRDVDTKPLTALAAELGELAEKARAGALKLDEMRGGTFTVTNLGGIGGTAFTPVVNLPESAILGLARAAVEPVFENGQFVPKVMLPLALSYDHRVVDGADGARFTRFVAEMIESPWRLLL